MNDAIPTTTIVHRAVEIDGVELHHFPSDRDVTGVALIFGVGQRDEALATLGSLHALEHLVMDSVRRTPISINASVDHSLTDFTAEGSPDLVARFIEGVCRGLAHPPTSRLAAEAKVLAAEGADETGTPLGPARYGFRDLGLAGAPGPGPAAVTASAVQSAARWFVKANALLLVDGPLPQGLRLPLSDGPPPDHHYVAPRRWTVPHAVLVDGPACAVSLLLPPVDGSGVDLVATAVIRERLAEVLRHERGLTYDLDSDIAAVAGQHWELVVLADPPEDRAVEAVRAMIETLTDLLTAGPSAAEVEQARALVLESSRGRDSEISSVMDFAIGRLLGSGLRGFDRDAVSAVRGERVAEFLRGLASDVLYLVDERAEGDLRRLGVRITDIPPATPGPLPSGEVFRPPALALALNREARSARVALTASGLAQQQGKDLWQVAWCDVAGVLRDHDGDLVVFGLDGTSIGVGPGLYRNGRRLVDAVLANVSAELIYDDPEPRSDDE